MSTSSYASDLSAASLSHSCEITQSNPSPQSGMGMVQPVVNEMFATVHAAGSSLLGLFTSCTTFDSTSADAVPPPPSLPPSPPAERDSPVPGGSPVPEASPGPEFSPESLGKGDDRPWAVIHKAIPVVDGESNHKYLISGVVLWPGGGSRFVDKPFEPLAPN
eukprot:scaffold745_cov113-Isochrysis_galbana.AAC.2